MIEILSVYRRIFFFPIDPIKKICLEKHISLEIPLGKMTAEKKNRVVVSD